MTTWISCGAESPPYRKFVLVRDVFGREFTAKLDWDCHGFWFEDADGNLHGFSAITRWRRIEPERHAYEFCGFILALIFFAFVVNFLIKIIL